MKASLNLEPKVPLDLNFKPMVIEKKESTTMIWKTVKERKFGMEWNMKEDGLMIREKKKEFQ